MNGVIQLTLIHTHFLSRLRQTPLLLGWLAIGPLVAFYKDGWMGLTFGLINLALIAFYAFLIHIQTPNPPIPQPVKHPRLELVLALGLFGLFFIVQLLDFDLWTLSPFYGWVKMLVDRVYGATTGLVWLPDWARQEVFMTASSTLKHLLPTLLMFLLLGYDRRAAGLTLPHWKLTATPLGLTSAFGLLTGFLTRAPLTQVLALYGIGILVNALPEELFFRGLLLSRLEKVFANPLNALVISALLSMPCTILSKSPMALPHSWRCWMSLQLAIPAA